MSRTALLLAGWLVACPAAAWAQTPPPPKPAPDTLRPRPPVLNPRLNPHQQLYRFQSEIFRQNLTRQALVREPAERVERAHRVGSLVDRGDCDGAEALARLEGDGQMARRVDRLCIPGRGLRN